MAVALLTNPISNVPTTKAQHDQIQVNKRSEKKLVEDFEDDWTKLIADIRSK
jgi:hypothetical protein